MSEYQHITIAADVTHYRYPHNIEIAARCEPCNIGLIWHRIAPAAKFAEFLRDHAAADASQHGPQHIPPSKPSYTDVFFDPSLIREGRPR